MRKGEIRKQAILDAAESLFGEKGYLDTTVEDILSALQCSKGSFYHYFDSKLAVLEDVCRERVARAFARYRNTRVGSTAQRLNALLYCACPFRAGEEDFLFVTLRLRGRGESAVAEGALRAAQRALFKPELIQLLMILNETGAARIARPRLDELTFEVAMAFYDEMCEGICRCVRQGGDIERMTAEVLAAARFLWERALDLPYGSVEIVPLGEMLKVVRHAADRLRAT